MPATPRSTCFTRLPLLGATIALAALSLGGCSSLPAKNGKGPADGTEIAQATTPETVKPAAGKPVTAKAATDDSGTAKPVPGYVDPMVASGQGPTNTAHASRVVAPQMASSRAPHPADLPLQAAQPAAALGEAIQQPTGVQANQNSIFALANAQVAEANGVPAYAPVRNFNPMSVSMFSAPRTPTASAGVPTASAAQPTGKDGLF